MVVYVPRKLCLAGEQTLPPSIPLIIHRSEEWAMKENCVYNCKSSEDEVEKQVTDSDEVQQTAAKSHKKGPLKVVPEALELLSQIQKPIAVLSIFGPYRSGKSYLLSQVLGCPDAFRVGHTMEPCTRGIWMATTILECEEFAVIFLDTEGADSVSFNDDDDVVTDRTDFIKKQLILTTLLSSVLVYNSLTVPEWSDLEDLSCLSQLSSAIVTKSTEAYDDISTNFPDFLWLIRDATLQLTDEEGRPISPTKYLKSHVLVRSENPRPTIEDCVVNVLLNRFPSISCQTLPRPSADPEVISSMVSNHQRVDQEFRRCLENLIEFILGRLKVKSISGMQCVSGSLLVELIQHFVPLVNAEGDVALEDAYIIAAEAKLLKVSQSLLSQYEEEMKRKLKDSLPLEETEDNVTPAKSLLGIHREVMRSKMELLQSEIDCLLPSDLEVNIIAEKRSRLASQFCDSIWKLSESDSLVRIIGGAFYPFVKANYIKSKQHCKRVAAEKFRRVSQMIHVASVDHLTECYNELLAAERNYYSEAIGPAKEEICTETRSDLEKSLEELKCIPGRPTELYVTGMAADKVELIWNEPDLNPDKVDYYEVQCMSDTEYWTTIPMRYHNRVAVIDSLDSGTPYSFQVRARSRSGIVGNWSDTVSCDTTASALTRGAAAVGSFFLGAAVSPGAAVLMAPLGGPLSFVAGLLGAPVAGVLFAKKAAEWCGPVGSLKEKPREEKRHAERETPPPAIVSQEVQSLRINEDDD